MKINGKSIGSGAPVYIIAEMSANHGQSFERAIEIVRAIKETGADAVKVQTYTADTLTIDHNGPEFQLGEGTIWEGRNLYNLYQEAYTPWEWQPRLMEEARRLGLDFFSTPFDTTSVDFLESMNVPAYKIASFEIVDLALIEYVAKVGRPMIMSTGMSSVDEIEEAVNAARAAGATEIALLKCTSAYPSPPEEMNLNTIPDLIRRFGVPVGLSDHTLGIAVPVAAVALGAAIVEKHFTLSRSDPGPDSAFSLEPAEFTEMVRSIRISESALGSASYTMTEKEAASRVFRRSLFVVEDIAAGHLFTEKNVRSIRPGFGLAPKHFGAILGKRAACNVARGTPLAWSMVEKL